MTFYFFEQVKEWAETHRKQLLAVSAGIVMMGVGILYVWQSSEEPIEEEPIPAVEIPQASEETETTAAAVFMVDVKGAVTHPGVYALSPESRVQDVITQAGGFTDDADDLQINLAQKVTDQMLIIVPKKGEVMEAEPTTSGTQPSSQTQIHINTATLEELQKLKGIGKKKAEQIIQYRTEHGAFSSKEELMEVKGIGQKLFESIQEEIVVP